MFMPPPLPAWYAAHPMIVHLPIGVLAITPVLLLVTMFARRMRQPMAFMTLLVLLVGVGGVVLAVASGEATEEVVDVPSAAREVMERHEQLGELARNVFLGIGAVYLLVFLSAVALGERFKRSAWVVAHVIVLGATCAALLILANAGHLGGRLVHEFGVRAPVGGLSVEGADAPP